ncbi:MAG: phosphate ABC transporter permease PstA [Desulfovibrionaceae bacterium]
MIDVPETNKRFTLAHYSSLKRQDKLFALFIKTSSFIAILPLIAIVWFLLSKGISTINANFFMDLSPVPIAEELYSSLSPSKKHIAIGGILNALVGMVMIVSCASIISIPFAIIIAIYVTETKNYRIANLVMLCVDVMQGLPSIILGIVVNIWLVETFSTYSAIAGSAALFLMMLPIVIKNSVETLSLVPQSLKNAALALGAPYWATILRVVLPASSGGIAVGALLAISRIMGETAPLLFTAFGNPYLSFDMTGPMETISMQIYKNALSPNTNLIENAWAAALFLVFLILIIHFLIKPLVEKWKIQF